jgi:hypothetical protein
VIDYFEDTIKMVAEILDGVVRKRMVAEISDIRWGREETDERTLTSVKSVLCIMPFSRTGTRILLFSEVARRNMSSIQ